MRAKRLADILYCLAVTSLFLFVRGYQFNSGDHEEHLPQVYQLLDPSLYSKDFFLTRYNEVFTIRYFYVQLVQGLSFFGDLRIVLFIVNLLCVFVSVFSFFQVSRFFSADKKVPYLSVLFIFILFYRFTVGENSIQYGILVCSAIAKAIASFALWQFFRKKYLFTASLLGIATLFQLLVGVQLMIILTIYCLWETRLEQMKRISLSVLVYLVFASPILVSVFIDQLMTNGNSDKVLFYELLFKYRNPTHYWPAAFPMKDYLKSGSLLIAGIVCLFTFSVLQKSFLKKFIAIILFLLLVHTIGFYMPSLQVLAFFQWFKTTIWLSAFLCIILASSFTEFIPKLWNSLIQPVTVSVLSLVISVILLTMITNSAFLPVKKLQNRYDIGNRKKSDLTLMNEWVEKNIPKDAVILTPPSENSFSCEAKRSRPISFRAVIHNAKFMKEWYDELEKIYHLHILSLDPGKKKLIEYAEEKYNSDPGIPYDSSVKIDYKLIDLEKYKPAVAAETVHRQGNWALLRL